MGKTKNNKRWLWGLAALFFIATAAGLALAAEETSSKTEKPISAAELTVLKAEWEGVRDEQVQMIREKQDQLEKLKEEIFSKMKNPGSGSLTDAQKADLQAARQKFSSEMDRQKESLRQLQAQLDEKAKQLQAERDRFEQEKKTAVR